jgi:hypothetical protein
MQAATDSLVQQSLGHAENAARRPQHPAALAAGQTMLLAPAQPLPPLQLPHDGWLASIARRTVQP